METKLITPMPLSPETTTVGVTAVGATEITVADISAFPDPVDGEEGSALLCAVEGFRSDDPADYETIVYTGRDVGNSKLIGVSRGVEGTARAWPAGTAIACCFVAEHLKRLNAVITTHKGNTATLANIGHVKHGIYEVTLNTTWSGSAAPYSKQQTVTGILATDTPIIDVIMSGTFATDEARIEAWGLIYRAVTAANKITFYATERPEVSLPLQIKVVR